MPNRHLKFPQGKIGPNFTKKILPWIETFWANHKRYPSDAELVAEFGFTQPELMRLRNSKFYNECLKNRGIRQNEQFLSERQVAAITLITNFADQRPVDAKLANIGVTPEMYQGWMHDPAFKRELQSRADEVLDNVYPEAQTALAKQVRNGNVPALKFYYEITGRASSPEAINLKMTMARMIEAVQKHVKDPAVLQAIAGELTGTLPVGADPSVATVKELYLETKESI